MQMASNMFREFSMSVVQGYNTLSNIQKRLFDLTYKGHLSSLPINDRTNYLEYNIEKIITKPNVLKVYFKNGERFVYSEDFTWINIP